MASFNGVKSSHEFIAVNDHYKSGFNKREKTRICGPAPDYTGEEEVVAKLREKLGGSKRAELSFAFAPRITDSQSVPDRNDTPEYASYLRRVYREPPFSSLQDCLAETGREMSCWALDLELMSLNVYHNHEGLYLQSMENLLRMLKELPEDVLRDHGDEDFGRLEYPSLYVILDDPGNSAFQTVLRFLARQETLSFAFYCVRDTACIKGYHPICVMLATDRYVFLVDWCKLGPNTVCGVIKPILESTVHKILHDAPKCLAELKPFDVTINNYWDVVQVEASLEKKPSAASTFRQFQQRYKKDSLVFEKFPDDSFLSVSQLDGHVPVRKWTTEVLENVLKRVVYLGLIKRLQVKRLMESAVRASEEKLISLFDYQSEFNGVETDLAADAAGWHVEPDAAPIADEAAEKWPVLPTGASDEFLGITEIDDDGDSGDEADPYYEREVW